MLKLPCRILLWNIKIVSRYLNWEHCISIYFKHSKRRICVCKSSHRTGPVLDTDSLLIKIHHKVMPLLMDMTVDWESDQMLESICDCLISDWPVIKAWFFTRRMMRNNYSEFSSWFDFMESLVEPRENLTWIISLWPKIKIEIVAGHRVDSDYVYFIKCCTIFKFKFLCIESILSVDLLSLLI